MSSPASNSTALRIASTLAGAIFTALTPIASLIALRPADYGTFSIVYLVAAFGMSLQYSIVSEAWARRKSRDAAIETSWAAYSTALTVLATLVGVAAVALALLIGVMPLAASALAGAALLTVYRSGARYHQVAGGRLRVALLSDVAGLVGFAVTWFVCFAIDDLPRVGLAWLASSLVAAITIGMPRLELRAGLISWSRRHAREIRPLLSDSLLMDLGAIGTPFLLAGFMGAHQFGVYRAVSNAAMPVRMMLDPVRPMIGRVPAARLLSIAMLVRILGAAVAFGGACFVVLVWLLPALPFTLGTLSELTQFAAPTALFVASNLLGNVFYVSCRTNASSRHIVIGRLTQTVLVVALPVVGFAVMGLTGAIWGFAISAALNSVSWGLIVRASRGPLPSVKAATQSA